MTEFKLKVRILGPFPNMSELSEDTIRLYVERIVLRALDALPLAINGQVEFSVERGA